MSKEFQRWLRGYEERRTNPYSEEFRIPSSWHSTKFDLENMDWGSIREIYIPELDCKFGLACNMMRKSWTKYKISKREGDRAWDTILKINRIQKALGLELTEFKEGPPISWVKEQLALEDGEGTGIEPTSEDLEIKYEEDQESRGSEDIWDKSESPEIPGEDSLYKQLCVEERAAALEDVGVYESESDEEW